MYGSSRRLADFQVERLSCNEEVILVAFERLGHHLLVALHHLVEREPEERAHQHEALNVRRGIAPFPVADGVS